ncbi:MAG: hypothetical protein MUP14_04245 [Dehalococcoidia bacterium]|nr:hypothetical protein [Dehalococcoidia bacterium]
MQASERKTLLKLRLTLQMAWLDAKHLARDCHQEDCNHPFLLGSLAAAMKLIQEELDAEPATTGKAGEISEGIRGALIHQAEQIIKGSPRDLSDPRD